MSNKSSLNFSNPSTTTTRTTKQPGQMETLAAPRSSSSHKQPLPSPTPSTSASSALPIPPPLGSSPEPVPTAPSFSLKSFLDEQQQLRFDVIYQKAGVHQAHYPVDTAIGKLTELAPYNTRSTSRQLLRDDILRQTSTFDSTTLQRMIHEAAEKISVLKKFQAFAEAQVATQTQELDTQIERLSETLKRLINERQKAQSEREAIQNGTHQRLDELVGVISFLDEWQEVLRQEAQAATQPQATQPTFLDDATIMKLLKAA
jgi:hypothetical protein